MERKAYSVMVRTKKNGEETVYEVYLTWNPATLPIVRTPSEMTVHYPQHRWMTMRNTWSEVCEAVEQAARGIPYGPGMKALLRGISRDPVDRLWITVDNWIDFERRSVDPARCIPRRLEPAPTFFAHYKWEKGDVRDPGYSHRSVYEALRMFDGITPYDVPGFDTPL